MENVKIIILAAGKGTRMQTELPKVLVPLKESTMIEYLLDNLQSLNSRPVVVVGYGSDLVKEKLGDGADYAHQDEQLGTGHAVKCAKETVGEVETVVILYGDMPLIGAETVSNLIESHKNHPNPLTIASVVAEDFAQWRDAFRGYGRIIRNQDGFVEKIVEAKDASEEELLVKEVNPAIFVVDGNWLWTSLEKLKNDNSQQEYYLTDLVGLAFSENLPITAIPIKTHEGLGANTPEQLEALEVVIDEIYS